jgi:hypothetical protein
MLKEHIHDNQNLLGFFYSKYRGKGLIVYSNVLSESPVIPANWMVSIPDILVVDRDEKSALFVESPESLSDSVVVTKWKSILVNQCSI